MKQLIAILVISIGMLDLAAFAEKSPFHGCNGLEEPILEMTSQHNEHDHPSEQCDHACHFGHCAILAYFPSVNQATKPINFSLSEYSEPNTKDIAFGLFRPPIA